MFNVELPPDSSWKWSTGITTEDQNEINRLESRVRELEAERDRLKEECVRWEAMYEGMMAERDGLEAELAKCQQVATPIGFGEILQSALDERDNLRTRHAALVEKVDQAEKWLSGGGDKVHVSIMLKDALAEVKK